MGYIVALNFSAGIPNVTVLVPPMVRTDEHIDEQNYMIALKTKPYYGKHIQRVELYPLFYSYVISSY